MVTMTNGDLLSGKKTLAPQPEQDERAPGENIRLHVSPSVRVVETQDGAVLLDLVQGICFGMGPVAVTIWHGLAGQLTAEQITDQLCKDHPTIEQSRIRSDVESFVDCLCTKRLLIAGTSDGATPKSRTPFAIRSADKLLRWIQKHSTRDAVDSNGEGRGFLFWKALGGLILFDFLGFGKNFNRLYECTRQWPVAQLDMSRTEVDRVCRAVDRACVWYPKRVLCVQRSVVTTCLLRHCGVTARMAMGAQRFPFKAHAWTEVDGSPVNERRDVRQFYLVWERC